jgi:hypothetical protein
MRWGLEMLNKTEIKRMCNKEYWEGAVRDSNNYGKFEIVEYVGYAEVHIRFLDTGYERVVRLNDIKNGTVKDKIRTKLKYEGKILTSNNYGDYKITKYVNRDEVYIKFIDTGYEVIVTTASIRQSNIKDRLKPHSYGIGYMGVGPYVSRKNTIKELNYSVWLDMLKRCYDEKYLKKQPTYEGCTVVPEWHNFQNFAKWFEENYIEGMYLDKDIIKEGNKIYGPETCKFVTPQENAEAASAKHYKLLNPEGEVVEVYNLTKFCRDNNMTQSGFYMVRSGVIKHYKGWVIYEEENNDDM